MVNWEAVGAIGEIVGAITVIMTLFYLSLQIRQNSRSLDRANEFAQAASIHDTNAQFNQVFVPIIQDSELASIYNRGLAGESLDAVEETRFALFIKSYLVWAEDIFFQQQAHLGFAAIADTTMLLDTIGPYIRKLLSTDAARKWWQDDAAHHFTPPFFEVIDRVVLGGESLEELQSKRGAPLPS